MSPGPTRVLQNVGDKLEGFIAGVRSFLDAQAGHKLETEFARLETETCSCACKIMGLASHFLGATEIAKGSISSVRDRTTLSTSTAYLIPGREHANGVAPKGFLYFDFLRLVRVCHGDKRLAAASHAIDLLPRKDEQFLVCQGHYIPCDIYRSKGVTGEAIHHYKLALEIASPFDWHIPLFWAHFSLAQLFFEDGGLNDAQTSH